MRRLAIAACVLLGFLAVGARPVLHAQTSSSSTPAHKAPAKKKKHHARHEPKQMAPTPDRIIEIQSALAREGCYQGDPTGKWDGATVAAMQKFQGDHGLDATGKIDALSLQKLGLGSEIAGVSAPRPVARPAPSAAPTGAAQPVAKPPAAKPSDASTAVSATSNIATPNGATTAPTTAATATPSTSASPAATPSTPPAPTPKPATPPQPQ